MIPKKIHQIYFNFYNKTFEENKLFVESAFMNLVYTKKHIDKYDINNYYFQDHKLNSWINTI